MKTPFSPLEELLQLLKISGPPGEETKIAQHLKNRLTELTKGRLEITEDTAHLQSEYGGTTGNLIARIKGNGHGPRRIFSAHMDTVPLAVGAQPKLDRQNNRILNDNHESALGGDNRTGCTFLLQIAHLLGQLEGNHAPVTLVFFCQEEVGLVGSRGLDTSLLGSPPPSYGFNFDGGDVSELVISVTGTDRFVIEVRGVPSHAGIAPEAGVSAAIIQAKALASLESDGWHGKITQAENTGSANVGILSGGSGSNILMPHLEILAEARSHDGNFRKTIIAAWEDAFRKAAAETHNASGQTGSVSFRPGPAYESFAITEDSPAVQEAVAVAKSCQHQLALVSNNGGMDANWLNAKGISTASFGCGQRNVHTTEEWIDLEEFTKMTAIVETLVKNFVAAN